MKQSCKTIGIFSFMLVVSAGTLVAQPYNIDQFGDGTSTIAVTLPPDIIPLPVQVTTDPTGGITNSPVLIYSLDAYVASGDVALVNAAGTITNLLRFYTPSGSYNSMVIYYSQSNGTPAGVGIPSPANPVEISQQSPITSWEPLAENQPGFPLGAIPVYDKFEYYINTTLTPSTLSLPSTISLSGTNLIWNVTASPENAGLQIRVVAATNLFLPMPNWTYITTNQLDLSGHCSLTLPIDAGKSCRFYRLAFLFP